MTGAHGLLVVDKPAGCTSHDVVAVARRAFRTRAIGHTGTLDPPATGVLVLALGEATKLVAHLTQDDKVYEARVVFGAETSTGDATGEVVRTAEAPALSDGRLERALASLLGERPQTVPLVSAVKVGGERLHAIARRGEEVERPVREVTLHSADVLARLPGEVTLRVHTGKGFYVRAFAEELGRVLGSAAHLGALRRIRSGAFTLDGAVSWDALKAAAGDASGAQLLGARLASPEAAWGERPAALLTPRGRENAFHGRPVAPEEFSWRGDAPAPPDAPVGCFADAQLVALAVLTEAPPGGLRVIRGLRHFSGDAPPSGQ